MDNFINGTSGDVHEKELPHERFSKSGFLTPLPNLVVGDWPVIPSGRVSEIGKLYGFHAGLVLFLTRYPLIAKHSHKASFV